jgi:hypothetical protein
MTVLVTTMLTAGGMAALAPSAAATEIVPRDLTVTGTGLGPENRTCEIDADLYVPPGVDKRHPAPALLATNGFGGTKEDQADLAHGFGEHGYVTQALAAMLPGLSSGDGPDVPPHPLDDLGRGRPRGEDVRDPQPFEFRDVFLRDDPAPEDDDVVDPAVGHEFPEAGEQRHVRPGEHRQPHGIGILLDDGLDDLLRRLVQAGVDDLHAGVAQGARHDLGAAVMPVEARLGDDHPDAFVHDAQLSNRTPLPPATRKLASGPCSGAFQYVTSSARASGRGRAGQDRPRRSRQASAVSTA